MKKSKAIENQWAWLLDGRWGDGDTKEVWLKATDTRAFSKKAEHIWRGVGKGDEFRMKHITVDLVDKISLILMSYEIFKTFLEVMPF